MTHFIRPSLGLAGRVFAIVLLAILIEFGASTFLYERASQLSVRDDEARRLAEHLVIARKLLAEEPPAARAGLARDLTTSRYTVQWSPSLPDDLRGPATLDRIHNQVVAWEPDLAAVGLRLRLTGVGRNAVIVGGLTLPDGSWMQFATREPVHDLGLSFERILFALAPAVAIILIAGALVRQTTLPIRRLARAADHVGSDDAEEVPVAGTGEVRRVIEAFNRMQARIHRLIDDRTQALAAVGHDLRTPLSRLRLRAEAVPDTAAQDAMQRDISEMEAMIASLLAYLGQEAEAEQPVATDLAVLCATVADDYRDHGAVIDYRGPDHLEHVLRPVAVKRAVVNLVENGLHYAGRVWIALSERDGVVVLRIEDDGPGIPEESIDEALLPFVRLDRARPRDTIGLGLGLSIVVRVVESEGAILRLANRREGGLSAEIRFPPARSA